MDFAKDRMGEVASIPRAQSLSHPEHQVEWLHQQQRSLTPERSRGYQRDSSTKTSCSLWSRSSTSACRPSPSCPLHSQRYNWWSFS